MRLSCRTRVDIQAADVLSAISPMSAVATPTPGAMIFIGRPLALVLWLEPVHAAIRPRKATSSGNSGLRPRPAHHGGRCQRRDAFPATGKAEGFRGGGLDADAGRLDAENLGNARPHRLAVGANARGLANDGNIDVHHLCIAQRNLTRRLAQEQVRGGAAPAWIGIGKELADIAF